MDLCDTLNLSSLSNVSNLSDAFAKSIDRQVLSAVNTLESKGFMAFLVGGCVRDILLGKKPKDYDIATNATPNEILEIFTSAGHKCLEIGKSYGTIAISKSPIKHCKKTKQNPTQNLAQNLTQNFTQNPTQNLAQNLAQQNVQSSNFIEVTTFRKDSEYIDGRHPKSVEFSDNITQDLARRDFTINAIAFSPSKHTLIDTFGGLNDIKSKTISCVGNPNTRFSEDYLRILRALRFCSTLGFGIKYATKSAIKTHIKMLDSLSKERLNAEFSKLILGDFACEVLGEFCEVLGIIFKVDCINREILGNIYLLKQTPKDLILRLSVLSYGIFGVGSEASKKAKFALKNLRYSGKIIESVCFLLDFVPSAWECVCKSATKDKQAQKIAIKMLLKDCDKNGETALKKTKSLLDFLDIICEKNQKTQVKKAKSMLKQIMDSQMTDFKECFCLSRLAINGDEVKSILQNHSSNAPQKYTQNHTQKHTQNHPQNPKIQGKHIGKILDFLLLGVIKEQIPNEQSALKKATINYLKSKGQK